MMRQAGRSTLPLVCVLSSGFLMSDLLATDRDLLRRFRDGNRDAMRQVFLHYAPKVSAMLQSGFAFQSAGRPFRFKGYARIHDIENARQEVFMRAFAPTARLNYDGIRPFEDYLFGIQRNYVLSEFRRHESALDQYLSLEESADELDTEASMHLPNADQLLEEQEVNQLLAEFVATLSDEQRRFYAARFAEPRTQEEAAEILGMTRIQVRRAADPGVGDQQHRVHALLGVATSAPGAARSAMHGRKTAACEIPRLSTAAIGNR
jgi:RNA polymerase sigma-70 factor (ECF subfamily)